MKHASQMTDAEFDAAMADIEAGRGVPKETQRLTKLALGLTDAAYAKDLRDIDAGRGLPKPSASIEAGE
jgi:hypothetical protein